MIVHIPAVLDEKQLVAVCAALNGEQAPWVDGRVTAGHQGAAVKNNQQLDASSSLARDLGNLILGELERNPLFISAVLPNRVFPLMFNRYTDHMGFGTHVDGAVRMIPGSAQKLRTDLSATLYLSPPDSYDGGELVTESDFGDRSIKLAAGDLVVYSAAKRHRVNPVTRGTRLAGVCWIQSLIRSDEQRIQLFELDRTIQALTRSGADSDSLVRLTCHYHALLRLWTDI